MSEHDELERLKAAMTRRDEGERSLIMSSLIRIEKKQAEDSAKIEAIHGEQKRQTRILFGDESDNQPGIVKRVDRLEGKMKMVWAAVTTSIGALVHGFWK